MGQLRHSIGMAEKSYHEEGEKSLSTVNSAAAPGVLAALGLTRQGLLQGPDDCVIFTPSEEFNLTFLYIQALDSFRAKEKLKDSFVIKWLMYLTKNSELKSSQLQNKLTCLRKKN